MVPRKVPTRGDVIALEAGSRSKGAAVTAAGLRPGRSLFAEHGVIAVPTLVLFRNGAEIARREGVETADEILSWLDEQA
jgi:hypothetical protein